MIIFRKARWKNFISSGNNWVSIQLDEHPNTLVVGDNGSGKSTMLDAMTFGLFGKPFRKINKPQLVNSINDGDCVVEIEFDIGSKSYLVRRGLKPGIFEIVVDGKVLDKLAAAKDSQAVLETQILKLNYKSFTQVVMLGSSTFVPFMQLSAANRREVIEDLLDIEIFSQMNSILKQQSSTLRDEVRDVDSDIALEDQMVSVQSRNLKRIHQDSQKTVGRYQSKIDALVDENTDMQATIDTHGAVVTPLTANTAACGTHKKSLMDAEKIDHKLEVRAKRLMKEVHFYHDTDECPTCQQDIDASFKDDAVATKNAELDKLHEGRADLSDVMSGMQEKVDHDTQMLTALGQLKTEIRTLESQMSANRTIIKSMKIAIDELANKGDVAKTKVDIATAQANLKALGLKKERLSNMSEVQKLATVLLKDSGIKTVIIRQYLPIMNKLINKYLSDMEFFVNFTLDESFTESIKSRHRDEFSYASFSEGEKMRIDLALLFTWRTVAKLKNSTNTNLLILDEVFDSSLDDAGTTEFLKILYTLGADQNVFVISHKGDVLQDKFNHVIKFEKSKGFSRII